MNTLQKIVQENLTEIVQSTTLSWELCNNLKEKKLVNQSEYEKLSNFLTSGLHVQGASYMFCFVITKWTAAEGHMFIEILREAKNGRVIDILLQAGLRVVNEAEGSLSLRIFRREEIEFLKGFHMKKFHPGGKFEGLQLGDEENANELLLGSVSGWTLLEADGLVQCEYGNEFTGRVKSTFKCLQEGTLWWNPNAIPLPHNFIPRKVRKLTTSGRVGDTVELSELTKISEPFLWLVDPPGMGKSTVTVKLEDEWRKLIHSNRVIVRINLNLVQQQLQQQKEEDDFSLASFLKRFVPFLPLDSLTRLLGGSVKVVVLLDGLDEVLPQHEDTMLRVLRSLLLTPQEAAEMDFESFILRRPDLRQSLRLEKVFLTTRPHLRRIVEKEFRVTAHSLAPLDLNEQILFLSQEVSGEFEFPQPQAKEMLSSLSKSAQALMKNPLMIFLFAQVVKNNRANLESDFLDKFELYEIFIRSKHTLHVVEKEFVDPKTQRQERNERQKCLLEDNLAFYYATALTQLQRPCDFDSLGIGRLPEGRKVEELLSVGLLTNNPVSSRIPYQFAYRSYAEFFYARLLTASSTKLPLRNALFRGIYEDATSDNIEEFVLCVLKKKRGFPYEPLLPISTGWIDLQEPQRGRFTMNQKSHPIVSLENFLRGRLFSLLGEEVLSSSIDLNHPKVIQTFEDVARSSRFDGVPLCRVLVRRDLQWIRTCLLKLPVVPIASGHQWKSCQAELVAHLRFADPKGLAQVLSEDEMQSALFSSDSLVFHSVCCRGTACDHPEKHVMRWLGGGANAKVMLTRSSLKASLEMKEAAWSMAEVVSRDQFTKLLRANYSYCDISKLKICWGLEFIDDLVSKKLVTERLYGGRFCDYGVKKLLGMLGEEKKAEKALRRILRKQKDPMLLMELEELEEKRRWKKAGGGEDGCLVRRVIIRDGRFLWDKVSSLPFSFLPFVIRYGKLAHVKKLFHEIPSNEVRTLEAIAMAFILSLLFDDTNNTYDYIRALVRNFYLKRRLSRNDFLSQLLSLGVDDLRSAVVSSVPPMRSGHHTLVREVSWGAVFLRTLPLTPNVYPSENSLELAVDDLLRNPMCCEVLKVLQLFLRQTPSLKELLQQKVSREVIKGRTGDHFISQSRDRCRLRGLIQFLFRVERTAFNWISTESKSVFLINVVGEIRLPSPHGDTSDGWAQITDLLPVINGTIRRKFQSESKCLRRLMKVFIAYVTEWEWSVVLETLQLIPAQTKSEEFGNETQFQVFGEPATPLLRIWLRYFGVEETRKVAEEIYPWKGEGLPGEAGLLAVNLGSLKILKEVAWPSILGWRDTNGRSLLQVAVDQWGVAHEVSIFLNKKFQVKLNS